MQMGHKVAERGGLGRKGRRRGQETSEEKEKRGERGRGGEGRATDERERGRRVNQSKVVQTH